MVHMDGRGTEPVGFRDWRVRQNGLYPIRRVEIELARGVLSYYFICFLSCDTGIFDTRVLKYGTHGVDACACDCACDCACASSCACRV